MPDVVGNISKASLYEFIERHQKIDESVEEAQYTVRALKKSRKELRAVIASAGFTLDVFDETMAKMQLSFEKREAYDAELRRNMAWVGMPLGTQAEMFSEDETAVPPEIQVSRVRDAGRTAGKLGRERGANPWKPGELLFSEWDSAWLAGKELAAQETEPKRRPGRPKKDTAAEKPAAGLRKGRSKKTDPGEPVFAAPPIPDADPADLDHDPALPNGVSGLEFDVAGSA